VNSLETQFCQERWLDIVDLGETSANGLIKKALVKIEEDIKNYEVFMKMLKGVVGIQGVVDKIIEICPLSPTEGADSRATVHHGREQVDGPTHGLACFTDWMTARDGKDVNAAALWASKNALWPKGKNIKVRFLGGKYPIWRNEKGKPITEGDILSIANSWHLSGDVPEFIEWKEGEGASDIRVRFVENGRSKSQVGTAAEKCAADEATMWLDLASPPHARLYYKHLILHEFGHALGLEHEHQRDDINKLLDDRKLKEYLKKIYPQMSDKEMNDYIESNWKALTPEVDAAKSKCPDVDSIMYYWLPADADVTGYEKPKRYPYELSVGDKKYIVQFYSGAKEPMETDDVSGSTSGSGLPDGVITDDHGGGLASVSEPQQSAAAPGILDALPTLSQLWKFKYTAEDGGVKEMELIPMLAGDWNGFGVAGLGMKNFKVNNLKVAGDDTQSMLKVFELFLRNGCDNGPATWRTVIKAMRIRDFNNDANELEKALPNMIPM
jgi:hypothetical protein